MGRKKVTSSDVAAASGVSQATVSMILNRRENVSFSRETVEKVEAAAKELGYQIPRRKMRRESNGNKLIVVFCPTLTNPYYVMLLHGIEEVAKEKNYGVFVCNTQRDLKIEENYLRMMKSVRPRGIIYTCNPSRSCKEKVEELAAEIPLVIINNREELLEIDAVELNNAKPGRLMARHLLELGHRHVAFVSPPLTSKQGQRLKRVEGFVREFEEAGYGHGVIVKSADEDLDEVIPSMDSEYKMGYYLTKEPADYTVGMILRLTEGSLAPVACMEDELNQCVRSGHCATLTVWKQLDQAINGVVDSITLADLVEEQKKLDGDSHDS